MANYLVETNIQPVGGGTFYYKYRKVVGGTWSSWINTSTTVTSPFTFTFSTPDALNTNIELSIYQDCKPGTSTTSTFTTNYICPCDITNVNNLVVGSCNSSNNLYSISFDVTYVCMRDDSNVITSVIKVVIDGVTHYFNPTLSSGTQTVIINNLIADGLTNKSISVTCYPA